jgi:hypothetical protein
MGKREWSLIWKLMRSPFLLLGLFFILLSVPCLFFPEMTISFFFSEPPSSSQLYLLKKMCYWLWVYFLTYGFGKIGMSFLVAAKDILAHDIYLCLFLPSGY